MLRGCSSHNRAAFDCGVGREIGEARSNHVRQAIGFAVFRRDSGLGAKKHPPHPHLIRHPALGLGWPVLSEVEGRLGYRRPGNTQRDLVSNTGSRGLPTSIFEFTKQNSEVPPELPFHNRTGEFAVGPFGVAVKIATAQVCEVA